MTKFTFRNLTNEEREITDNFFDFLERMLPDSDDVQEKYNKFFILFVELCHQRNFDPNQLKLDFS